MRKTIFNYTIKARILNAARRGASRRECAKQAGIHPKTLYLWLSSEKEELQDFIKEFLEIESEYDLNLKESVVGSGDARTAFRLYQERNKSDDDKDDTQALTKLLLRLQGKMSVEAFNELIDALENIDED
jgi:lambda repressor-like predicted transcriptional regulator